MVPMACGRLRHCLLLLLLLGASQAAAAAGDDVKKVPVALYYESLCPYSARLVAEGLSKVFEDGLIEAVDLKLVPYGNAKLEKNGTISCQHGPDECLINAAEACAMDVWLDLKVHFSFINCVESLVAKNFTYEERPSCFAKLGLDSKPFDDCFKSERANKLSLKLGKETDALVPPHLYVPWLLVDGKPLYDDYMKTWKITCAGSTRGAVLPRHAKAGGWSTMAIRPCREAAAVPVSATSLQAMISSFVPLTVTASNTKVKMVLPAGGPIMIADNN